MKTTTMINYVIYEVVDYVPVPKNMGVLPDYRFASLDCVMLEVNIGKDARMSAGLCDVGGQHRARMPECRVSGQSDDDETTTMINYVIYEVVDYVPERMPECRVSGQSDDDEDYYDDKLCDLRSRGLCSCSETWVHFDYRELR
ncbi:hypothetical protein CEXT_277601 [Caerostris extrusa]|uniref:Uncharacterized protein n=1 Tax=Caerostris extrusa TaxID=172846 RepID=A0AAV4NX60_CAEEX|nr:hypothetical protein CEXT_277601 [Caerostris extrusa]